MSNRVVESGKIIVVVEGGMVQDILNVPPGVSVLVVDYDTEGIETDRLCLVSMSEIEEEEAILSEYTSMGTLSPVDLIWRKKCDEEISLP